MSFLKEKTDFAFPQIRIYLVVGSLCMEEFGRSNALTWISVIHIRTQIEKLITSKYSGKNEYCNCYIVHNTDLNHKIHYKI